jgi:hypothetical protein
MITEFRNDYYALANDVFFRAPLTNIYPIIIVLVFMSLFFLRVGNDRSAVADGNLSDCRVFRFVNHRLLTLLAGALFAVNLTRNFAITDEVAINLKHPYNLYHFGRFSFSPAKMVDGTVEYFFYLLHYPFAANVQQLLFGNWFISLIIGLLIFNLFAGSRLIEEPLCRGLFLLVVATFAPLFMLLGNGFGGGLLAVAFLGALLNLVQQNWRVVLLFSSVMPLIRPDGILWSIVIAVAAAFAAFCEEGSLVLLMRYRLVLLYVVPAFALSLYGLSTYILYGHLVPTPILFKNIKVVVLLFESGRLSDIFHAAVTVLSPDVALLLCVVVPMALSAAKERPWSSSHQKLRIGFAVFAMSTVLLCGFSFINQLHGLFLGDLYIRYGTNAYLALLVVYAILIDWSIKQGHGVIVRSISCFIPVVLIVFQSFGLFLRADSSLTNRYSNYAAGALTQDILNGTELTISTTEMDSFGLGVSDRQVLDYWGYTNRHIAQSTTCNGDRAKFDSSAFLEDKPDLYWPYWFTANPSEHNYDTVERSFALFHHTSRAGNRLGNLLNVFELYDTIILHVREMTVVLLVRKDRTEQVFDRLSTLEFVQSRSRPFDNAIFKRLYESVPKVSFSC